MSTNHKIFSQGDFELYIDEHSNRFNISISRVCKSTGEGPCSIELNDQELKDVCIRMIEVVSYYNINHKDLIKELLERIPEFKREIVDILGLGYKI